MAAISYRAISSFGKDAVRKFSANSSEMKHMAARDLENLLQVLFFGDIHAVSDSRLQCAIPVFDGLLPEPHNRRILDLLFVAAHWHSLAKLRMHTDLSLEILDTVTVSLGEKLRLFQEKTCSVFPTRELRREADTRQRRSRAAKGKAAVSPPQVGSSSTGHAPTETSCLPGTRRPKTLNLNTYKLHALGDYASMIRQYGTSDSYSTEVVSRVFFGFLFLSILSPIRANWNTVRRNPDTPEQVARPLPSNWPRLSGGKYGYVVFETISLVAVNLRQKMCLVTPTSITISAAPKITPSSSASS